MTREESESLRTYRDDLRESDCEEVRRIITSTGFFSQQEVEVAVELVVERLEKGIRSGYYFLFAEEAETLVGYSCFGPIACTISSYDLYWIAVQGNLRGRGLGRDILACTENTIAANGGNRVYVETSYRPQYNPTRHFYERCGYKAVALLQDFFAPGDDKVIYQKDLV